MTQENYIIVEMRIAAATAERKDLDGIRSHRPAGRAHRGEYQPGHRGQEKGNRADPGGAYGRGTHFAGGRPRHRQNHPGQGAGPLAFVHVQPRAVYPRPASGGYHRHAGIQPAGRLLHLSQGACLHQYSSGG